MGHDLTAPTSAWVERVGGAGVSPAILSGPNEAAACGHGWRAGHRQAAHADRGFSVAASRKMSHRSRA
jgi:hypothetical protein